MSNELQESEQLVEFESIFRRIMGEYYNGSINLNTKLPLYDKTVKVLEESLDCTVETPSLHSYKISWDVEYESK